MHTVLTHPLVRHRVTLMRDINTKPKQFRELVNEITQFLAIESLKDLRTVEVPVTTPDAKTTGVKIEDRLRDKDTRRRVFYRSFAMRDWGVCENYHLMLDSGVIGMDRCVQIICDAAK